MAAIYVASLHGIARFPSVMDSPSGALKVREKKTPKIPFTGIPDTLASQTNFHREALPFDVAFVLWDSAVASQRTKVTAEE